ncbi:response regulator transcription factor [Candidatus Bipolaricaulota bacterium]|nr:response regulator transcription factor [Candidatus Bipolaricaulota bacterium]RLE31330.1 MAG: DNA-binding response regulator [Candidatus Acetothermia bacterium]
MKTILLVEDEREIARMVQAYLMREGYRVEVAFDGEEGWRRYQELSPDLIILDLMLPKLHGLELARKIRRVSDVPIIMLTALSEEADRVAGLELGADDYVTKPFSLRELAARVRAVLRRAEGIREPERLSYGPLEIDLGSREVRLEGRSIDLTPIEFDLLAYLARHPGKVFTRRELLSAVQERSYASFPRTIDSHIKNLRHKIEPDPKNPRFIVTVHGVGYKFQAEG